MIRTERIWVLLCFFSLLCGAGLTNQVKKESVRPKSNYEKAQSIIGGALGLCYMDLGQPTIEGPFSDPRGAYRSNREPAVETYLNCVQSYVQESIENILLYGGDATDKTGEIPAEVIKGRKHD